MPVCCGLSGTERDTDQRTGARPDSSEHEGVSPLPSAEDPVFGRSGNGAVHRARSEPDGRADEGPFDPGASNSTRGTAKPCGSLKGRFGRHLNMQRQPSRMSRTHVLRFNGGRHTNRNRQYDDGGYARTN